MPFRSRETLQGWVEQFRDGHEGADLIEVVAQDGSDGADTGLVLMRFLRATTTVYMQPAGPGDPGWLISFESRDRDFDLTPAQLHVLSSELAVAAALCEFLEAKSRHHLESQPA